MKVKLLPLARLFMFQCLLTMVLALPLTNANAQGNYGNTIQSQVNRYLNQGDRINLNQSLNLQQVLRQGKELLSVSVTAQSTQYGSKLVLLLNGQRIDAKPIGTYMNLTTFSVPRQMMQGDRLVVKVKGAAFVQKVSAQLSSYGQGGGQGQGQVIGIKARINQQLYGPTTLPVRKLIKQTTGAQLNGMKVKKVFLKASSRRGRATVQLLINGMPVGYAQTIPMQEQRIAIALPSYGRNIVGQDIKSIKLQIQGRDVFVKVIGVRVIQQGQGGNQGGGHNSAQVQVNQRFNGSQRVMMSQLIRYNSHIDMHREVEAITITANGRGSIMLAGGGQGQGGIQVQGHTTQSLRVHGYGTSLSQLKLRISGNMTIRSIRIKFKRRY